MINLDILSQIHYILTLIFGIALSASFLDAHKQRGGLFKLGLFTVVFSILQQLVYYHFARQDTLEYFLRFYPFFIHLPLIVFLVYAFRAPCFSAVTGWPLPTPAASSPNGWALRACFSFLTSGSTTLFALP